MSEIFEELEDYIEDILEMFLHKRFRKERPKRKIKEMGTDKYVRPAYIAAQRVEYLIKIIFAFSIMITAIVSTIWGVTSTSALLKVLLSSIAGRFAIFLVGLSYLINSLSPSPSFGEWFG